MHRVIVCLLLISNAAGFSPGAPGLARSGRLASTCDAVRQRLCTGRLTLLQTLRSQLDKVEVSAVQRMTKVCAYSRGGGCRARMCNCLGATCQYASTDACTSSVIWL